jgi:hypothetical protein
MGDGHTAERLTSLDRLDCPLDKASLKQLTAFVKWMAREQNLAEFERRKIECSMPGYSLDTLFADE